MRPQGWPGGEPYRVHGCRTLQETFRPARRGLPCDLREMVRKLIAHLGAINSESWIIHIYCDAQPLMSGQDGRDSIAARALAGDGAPVTLSPASFSNAYNLCCL
jgi:hypothetical protein